MRGLMAVGVAAVGSSCAVLQPAAAPERDRVTIGAIRWDAWFADTVNPYERNLADGSGPRNTSGP